MEFSQDLLETMFLRVEKLHTLMCENGFAQSIKDQGGELKKVSGNIETIDRNFSEFLLTRHQTCPHEKKMQNQEDIEAVKKEAARNRRIAIGAVIVSFLIGLPGWIQLIPKG